VDNYDAMRMMTTLSSLLILDVDESQEQQKVISRLKIRGLVGVAHMPTQRECHDYIADEICIIFWFWDKSFQ